MLCHQQAQETLSRCISTESTCGSQVRQYDGYYDEQSMNNPTYIKDRDEASYYRSELNSGEYIHYGNGVYSQLPTSFSAYSQVPRQYYAYNRQIISKDGYYPDFEVKLGRSFFDPVLASNDYLPIAMFDPPCDTDNKSREILLPPFSSPYVSRPISQAQSSLYRIAPEDHAAALVEQPAPRSTALPTCLSTLMDPQTHSQLSHDGKVYHYSPSPEHSPGVLHAEPLPLSQGTSSRLVSPHHQSISPKQHSTYSELSANVDYFSNVDFPSHARQSTAAVQARASSTRSPADTGSETFMAPIRVPQKQVPVSSLLRKSPSSPGNSNKATATATSSPQQPVCTPPSKSQEKEKPQSLPSSTSYPKTAKSASKKKSSEPKRLSLACLFCRERKIACGRPAAGSLDQRCNQCVRRSFQCQYPTESRRGQHKRLSKKTTSHEVNDAK